MRPDGVALPGAPATTTRAARRIKPRRPWMLIAACLLLVGLSATLWGKWVENRERADRLAAELKKVYVEAEIFFGTKIYAKSTGLFITLKDEQKAKLALLK